ncbi:MAG TPA: AI-2E family transporter [Aldersonia sp.]
MTARSTTARSTQPEVEAPWSLPRGVIVLLGLAGTVVAIAGAKEFASVIGPTFLALMLTVTVQPLPDWLRRKGLPGWLALLIALLMVWGILAVLVVSLVVSVAKLATLLPTYADDMDQLVANAQDFLQKQGIGGEQGQQLISNVDASKVIDLVGTIVESALGVFSNLLFIIVLLLFMAVDAITYSSRMNVLNRMRPDIAAAFSSFARGTRTYLVVSTIFGLIVAGLDSIALWWLGIPLPILWGILAFITNYIPNIGFVIGLIPPALLGLLQGGPKLMIAVIVVYSVINVTLQSVIQPKFVGDAVGLSVTLTFLSLVFWAWVIGPLGAILAIPLSLMAKALLVDIDPSTRWADVLLTSKVKPDNAERAGPPPDADTIPTDGASDDDVPSDDTQSDDSAEPAADRPAPETRDS